MNPWRFSGFVKAHVMSKAYQYATNDNKTFIKLRNVNVKKNQISLYKAIT
jgi:hypothetical protein